MKKLNYHITNHCSPLCLVTLLSLLGMVSGKIGAAELSFRDPTQPPSFKTAPAESHDTRQDFDVRAIFADDTHANPRAIIGCCLFKIGDEVSGYTIVDINREGVTLKNSHGKEIFAILGNDKMKYPTAPDEEHKL